MMATNKKKRRYKVTVKVLASAIFNKHKAKYLNQYSTTTNAKKNIQEVIEETFNEISENVLNDKMVEIWGFGRFSLKMHKRFLTKYIQCDFGHTIKKKLKENQKEYLREEIHAIQFEILEMEAEEIPNEKELEKKKKELEKLMVAYEFKTTSLNPKYRKDE